MKDLDLTRFGMSGKSFNILEWVILRQWCFRSLDLSYLGKWMREAEKPENCGARKRDSSYAQGIKSRGAL